MKLAGSGPFGEIQVEDYLVTCLADGVKDTAAIRVAATLLPEGIVGAPERPQGPRRKALFVGICYAGTQSCRGDAIFFAQQNCEV